MEAGVAVVACLITAVIFSACAMTSAADYPRIMKCLQQPRKAGATSTILRWKVSTSKKREKVRR